MVTCGVTLVGLAKACFVLLRDVWVEELLLSHHWVSPFCAAGRPKQTGSLQAPGGLLLPSVAPTWSLSTFGFYALFRFLSPADVLNSLLTHCLLFFSSAGAVLSVMALLRLWSSSLFNGCVGFGFFDFLSLACCVQSSCEFAVFCPDGNQWFRVLAQQVSHGNRSAASARQEQQFCAVDTVL